MQLTELKVLHVSQLLEMAASLEIENTQRKLFVRGGAGTDLGDLLGSPVEEHPLNDRESPDGHEPRPAPGRDLEE